MEDTAQIQGRCRSTGRGKIVDRYDGSLKVDRRFKSAVDKKDGRLKAE